ncbi:MAG: hypothetical protein MN733_36635 [Nitrososphaera sp.]|nr:hypothetical protein [Nitrososphaera sp.]
MEIFVDFDGTISPCHYPDALTLPPVRECVEQMLDWKRRGFTIVIWSCRANPKVVENSEESVAEMVAYLKKHGIPYDRIDTTKPLFNLLIDDRAHNAHGFWKSCAT